MATTIRRKRHTTPRFKPDMWGRTPVPQGVVLYDGALTMAYDSDQHAYGGTFDASEHKEDWESEFDAVVTLNDNQFEGQFSMGQMYFAVGGEMVGGLVVDNDTATVFALEGYATEGENTLTILKKES